MDSLPPPEIAAPSLPNGGDLVAETQPAIDSAPEAPHAELLHTLWIASGAEGFGLDEAAFSGIVWHTAERYRFGAGTSATLPNQAQQAAFLGSLQVRDLALARACAAGHEGAWATFVETYRTPLTQAAVAITRSSTLGEDLAGSLYAELWGLAERDGVRRSPLAGYAGRGSLMGWLRTLLAQRSVDHYRRTRRESPLEEAADPAAAPTPEPPAPLPALARLTRAVTDVLEQLPAEGRMILASYFLDGRTLAEIGRLLRVHEATISRRVHRLTADLRAALLARLEASGFSRRQAQEALGTDPRDLAVNLRTALQGGASGTIPVMKRGSADTGKEAR